MPRLLRTFLPPFLSMMFAVPAWASPTLAELQSRATAPRESGARIPTVEGVLEVDGSLSEPFWDEALVWSLPYEIDVGENGEAPAETYVLMTTSGRELRVAFVNVDPASSAIRGTFADRDRWSRDSDDAVGLYLDTFGDERNAYYLKVNARGVQFDAMRLDRGGQGVNDDSSFDLLWSSAARIDEKGYIVEIELPFRSVRFGSGVEGLAEWKIMPYRVYPREFRFNMTAFRWDYNRNCFLCQLPSVQFEMPEAAFRPLQAIPYTSAIAERIGGVSGRDISAGVDIKYQHPSWVLDATILPDFSQVETDEFLMTTNVRFLPRVAERRPFFMERADLFRFPISNAIHTRSMLDPTAGLRWTGKEGPHNWAALPLHDRATWLLFPGRDRASVEVLDDQPSRNTLLRYRYDRSAGAVMGVMVADRDYEGGYNRMINLDGQFALGSQHTFVAQLMRSTTQYPGELAERLNAPQGSFWGTGYLVRLARSGRNFNYRVETRDFEDGLVTGLGFQQRTGVREINTSPSYTFWPSSVVLRNIRVFGDLSSEWDRSTFDALNVSLRTGVSVSGSRQSSASVYVERGRERFREIPFDLNRGGGSFSMTPRAWYEVSIDLSRGHAVDVRLAERMLETRTQIDQTFFLWDRRMRLEHQFDRMNLFGAGPAQSAVIHRLQAEVQLTRGLSVRTIGQWLDFRWKDPRYEGSVPDHRRQFENQTLVRYRINYASAFYLGFYTGRERIDGLHDNDWNVFTKFSFLL